MTTVQRNAIAAPVEGLMVYNTDEKAVNVFNGTSWAPASPVVCGQPFTDSRDGKVYNTVQIGLQCWMKENLNIGNLVISTVVQTNNGVVEKYCFNNLETNCDVYGGIYQWDEIMSYTTTSNSNPSGRQGICPTGWHVPSDAEWCQTEVFLDATVTCASTAFRGIDAGGKLKETGTTHWASPNTGATNTSGFTAIPGGYTNNAGYFIGIANNSAFWSSTQESSTFSWVRNLAYFEARSERTSTPKMAGMAIRCLKD
jgi:uncharacterized protein (TIGR02145 family)